MKTIISSIAAFNVLVLASQFALADGISLESGVPVDNLSGARNEGLNYEIEVSPGATNLSITLSGGRGDADLYVRRDNQVSPFSFDCRSWNFYNNESCVFENPEPGTYNILVRGYGNFSGATLLGQIEGDNTPPPPSDPSTPEVVELTNGEAISELSDDSGNAKYFSIEVPANAENLNIAIEGGTGDAELYVKLGEQPTDSDYDCHPGLEGNVENCVFETPEQGVYYIMLYAYGSYDEVSLTASYDEVTTPDDPGSTDCNNLTSEMQALLDAHNEARAAGQTCGSRGYFEPVPALTWSCELGEAALAHSVDMTENNFFSHTGSNGSNHSQRIRNTGFEPWYSGENIAAGQQSVASVMSSWLSSDGHCANIMSPNFTVYGGARVDNNSASYRSYWTSVFASPSPY